MTEEIQSGIVTSIKLSSNPLENSYTIFAQKSIQIKSEMQLDIYERVEMMDGRITLSKGISSIEEYQNQINANLQMIAMKENAAQISLSGKEYEKVANALMPQLLGAATLLVKSFLSGAPIVIRFHNDGDGSSGGIALYRAISELQKRFFVGERNISWQMNKSIAYTIESFYVDKMLFDSYRSVEKPLVLITDFGTSPESLDAIKAASKDCNLIWLDHHMPYEGFPKELITHYINVFDFGGDSNFTAGLLTCIFAELISKVNVEDLKQAALISDYSAYANFKDQQGMKNSVILDFLTSTGRETYGKPKQMDLIISDRQKSEETFAHASNMLDEAITTGIKNIKSIKTSNGINIAILDFGHVAKLKFDYPLPGRYSSKLQDRIERANNGKTITVVHYGNYISVRLSKDISDSVRLLEIIERMKVNTKGAVTGGGHKQAASIRANKENMKEIMDIFLAELGVRL